jgi:hypothetical protein
LITGSPLFPPGSLPFAAVSSSEGGKDMTTGRDALVDFAELLGRAFAIAIAVGLVLTAAAVVL